MDRKVTIRLTPLELALLDRFAADHEMTRSEVIRNAVTAGRGGRLWPAEFSCGLGPRPARPPAGAALLAGPGVAPPPGAGSRIGRPRGQEGEMQRLQQGDRQQVGAPLLRAPPGAALRPLLLRMQGVGLMQPDHVYIDIRTCDLTLSQVMARVAELQKEHPDQEIFMDGDLYAIVGRRRIQKEAVA